MAAGKASRIGATVLGYPRFGPDRELKRIVESYWAGRTSVDDLLEQSAHLRASTWQEMTDAGLDTLPGNTFSWYDHVLDAAWMLGAIPDRFADLGLPSADTYFAMARGTGSVPALEMTKWFDTNYHYLVPELCTETEFSLDPSKILEELEEAREIGIELRPVVVGPVSFLLLSKPAADAPPQFSPLDLLDEVVEIYADLVRILGGEGVAWVQFDEPCLVQDRSKSELAALERCYRRLGSVEDRPRTMVATYFGDPGPALPVLASSPIEALAIDLVNSDILELTAAVLDLADKTVVAGVVDGRNIWRTDLEDAISTVVPIMGLAGSVAVSTSCSLLHVPYDVDRETGLDEELRSWLAFARQKTSEVVTIQRALTEGLSAVELELETSRRIAENRKTSPRRRNDEIRNRLAAISPKDVTRSQYRDRRALHHDLGLPLLTTTTIGSYPQTGELRRLRAQFKSGEVSVDDYNEGMRSEIDSVIRLQEDIGLDVLVHGEPERNDMVQYFAEQLDGYAATEHGWVQSYGSIGVRPPILFGDISRPAPMTVEWATYAQSLTERPVKGMITGPVTMLAWSFVRDDQAIGDTALQVALAIRDETTDLESAGLRVIQVDEPALRELLPLREADRSGYLDWAVAAFKLATSGISDAAQLHTHMCYGEFSDIITAIEAMDVDVISLEASRSQMEILDELSGHGFTRAVGPGVYDVHSPRVPSLKEVSDLLSKALTAVGPDRLWVNPDCGLKTRAYAEVEPSLRNMVAAASALRDQLAQP